MFDTSVTPPTVGASGSPSDRRPVQLYVFAFAAIACVLSLLATAKGPGLDPDSVVYLSTGQNLAHGEGLTVGTGENLTVFPPGIPVLAALGELAGTSGEQTIRWVNAACAGAMVLLGHLLLRRLHPRQGVLVGATALLTVAPSLAGVTRMASSEALFVVATLLFLLLLGSIWRQRRLTLGSVASLAALLARVPAALRGRLDDRCWSAGAHRRDVAPQHARILKLLTFCVLAGSVPVAWVIRNHAVDGTLLGPRVPSPDSVGDVAARVAGTIGRWVLGGGTQNAVTTAGGAMAVVIVVIALAVTISPQSNPTDRRRLRSALAPSAIFALVYVSYIAMAQLSTGIDPIDHRLLCPVFVPMLLLVTNAVTVGLDRWTTASSSSRGRLEIAAVGVLLIVGQLALSVRDARAGATDGIGFNAAVSQESELAATALAVAAKTGAELYTNSVEDLWAATGRRQINRAPAFAGIRNVALSGEREKFATAVACSDAPVLLAMYTDGDPKIYDSQAIADLVDLEVAQQTGDGTLYRATPLAGTTPEVCDGK